MEIVAVQNVLTTDQHDDLGFAVGDRMLIMVGAQSAWPPQHRLPGEAMDVTGF